MKNIHYAWLVYIATYPRVIFQFASRTIFEMHIIVFPYFMNDFMICILIDRYGSKIDVQNGEKLNDSKKSNANAIVETIHRF